MYGKGLRALSLATFAAADRHVRARLLLRPARRRPGLHPEDLLRARAGRDRDALRLRRRRDLRGRCTCARATASWDLRSYVVIHIALIFNVLGLLTGLDLGEGVVGPLVGVGRADARVVPDRVPAVRDVSAAALLDRGSRAPGALRVRLRDHGRRVRAAELRRRARRHRVRAPARVRRRAAAGCRARWRSSFVCALVAIALLFALLCSYEIAAKQTRWQLRALRRRLLGERRGRAARSQRRAGAAASRAAGAGARRAHPAEAAS